MIRVDAENVRCLYCRRTLEWEGTPDAAAFRAGEALRMKCRRCGKRFLANLVPDPQRPGEFLRSMVEVGGAAAMSDHPKLARETVLPAAERLAGILSKACHRIEIAGSLRRGRAAVGDIELVAIPKIEPLAKPGSLYPEPYNLLWEGLDGYAKQAGWRYLNHGQKYRKFLMPYDLRRPADQVQVDLFTCEPENWGNIFLIRTGPAEFSQAVVTRLRECARPSSGGFVRLAPSVHPEIPYGGEFREWTEAEKARMEKVPTPREEDVFEIAGMEYVPPDERDEWREGRL